MSIIDVPPVNFSQAKKFSQQQDLAQAIASGRARPRIYSGSNWVTSPGAVTAGATVSAGLGFFVNPGKRFFLTGLEVSADGPCAIRVDIAPDANGDWASWIGRTAANLPYLQQLWGIVGANGGDAKISIPAGLTISENSSVTVLYKSPTTAGRNVAFLASGYELDDETFTNAMESIAIFGDSTAWGGNLGKDSLGRSYLGKWQWSRRFVDLARAASVDAGVVANMAEDGKTMREGYYNLATGKYFPDAKTWIVSYGMNDAASANFPSQTDFNEAAFEWINRRNRLYPDKSVRIVYLAPSNTDDADRTPRIATVRSWISAVANDATLGGATNKVYYVDQSQAWSLAADATTDTNIKSQERISGSRVHPSGIGSSAIGDYLWAQLKGPLYGK